MTPWQNSCPVRSHITPKMSANNRTSIIHHFVADLADNHTSRFLFGGGSCSVSEFALCTSRFAFCVGGGSSTVWEFALRVMWTMTSKLDKYSGKEYWLVMRADIVMLPYPMLARTSRDNCSTFTVRVVVTSIFVMVFKMRVASIIC